MNIVDHMMKLYEEALDEMMGAQKYMKIAMRSEHSEDQNMYRMMAKQELEHGHNLIKAGDRLFSTADSSDSLKMVWDSLKRHLTEWHDDILHKLG